MIKKLPEIDKSDVLSIRQLEKLLGDGTHVIHSISINDNTRILGKHKFITINWVKRARLGMIEVI